MWEIKPEGGKFVITGVEGTETKRYWAENQADGDWLVAVLDEATQTVVKLFCKHKSCKGYGGFITRVAQDARKTMYVCDECGKPMTRKVPGEDGEDASEKQPRPPLKRAPQSQVPPPGPTERRRMRDTKDMDDLLAGVGLGKPPGQVDRGGGFQLDDNPVVVLDDGTVQKVAELEGRLAGKEAANETRLAKLETGMGEALEAMRALGEALEALTAAVVPGAQPGAQTAKT